jgi:hypothetical protein
LWIQYPSISEKLLNEALAWASDLATITENDISIIKHARKSLLFGNGKLWTKKDRSNSLFDTFNGHDVVDRLGCPHLTTISQLTTDHSQVKNLTKLSLPNIERCSLDETKHFVGFGRYLLHLLLFHFRSLVVIMPRSF